MKVIFFEDFPYTARISYEAIQKHVKELERQLDIKVIYYLNSLLDCSIGKEHAIRVYKSQLNEEICLEVLRYLNNLSGERL